MTTTAVICANAYGHTFTSTHLQRFLRWTITSLRQGDGATSSRCTGMVVHGLPARAVDVSRPLIVLLLPLHLSIADLLAKDLSKAHAPQERLAPSPTTSSTTL